MAGKSSVALSDTSLAQIRAGVGFLLAAFVAALLLGLAAFGEGSLTLGLFGVIPSVLGIIGVSRIRFALEQPATKKSASPRKTETVGTDILTPWPDLAPEQPREELPENHRPLFAFGSLEMERSDAERVEPVRVEKKKARKPEPSFWEGIDWEQWIGQKLLQKVGVLIVLIGMVVFLKYSFDRHLVDELGRIVLSAVGALALLGAGEWFHKKYPLWSHAFTGGGLALLYFTVWAAHVFYHAELLVQYGISISPTAAMGLYSLITLLGAVAAVRYRSQTIAWFSVLGGYLTPFLIASSSQDFITLTVYLAILAAGVLALAWHQKWSALTLAAFVLTQLYLFGIVYVAEGISDAQQVVIAIGFFTLFALPPLLAQLRLRKVAEPDDIGLILLDGLCAFVAVVNALGGFGGPYVGLVSMVLALVYLAFAAMALTRRADDEVLVTTYLVTGIALVALSAYAQWKWQWVAAAWAPLSVLLLAASVLLKRKSVLYCALAILTGSLLFLLVNLPFAPDSQTFWQPFTSHWAILDYIFLASIVAWIYGSAFLSTLLTKEDRDMLVPALHTLAALGTFAWVTFEATGLQWDVTLRLAYAYLAFSIAAIILFAATRRFVWFAGAFCAQVLVLLFTFFSVPSDMLSPLLGGAAVLPLFHPWAAVSLALLVVMAGFYAMLRGQKNYWANTGTFRGALITIFAAQVWMHGTVEIQHMHLALWLTDTVFQRVLSGWWIAFTVPFFVWGIAKKNPIPLRAAIACLCLPLVKDLWLLLDHAPLYELSLWTALPLLLLAVGSIKKNKDVLWAGAAMLVATMGADMAHAVVNGMSLLHLAWWTAVPIAAIVASVWRKERDITVMGIGMLVGAMAADCIAQGGGNLDTLHKAWWTVVPLVLLVGLLQRRERNLSMAGVGMLVLAMALDLVHAQDLSLLFLVTGWWAAIAFVLLGAALWYKERTLLLVSIAMLSVSLAFDGVHTIGSDTGLLRTVWWTLTGLVVMGIGFARREKVLRQFAICLFGATVIKLLVFDFAQLSTGVRIGASLLTGLVLIGASYLYQRFDSLVEKKR